MMNVRNLAICAAVALFLPGCADTPGDPAPDIDDAMEDWSVAAPSGLAPVLVPGFTWAAASSPIVIVGQTDLSLPGFAAYHAGQWVASPPGALAGRASDAFAGMSTEAVFVVAQVYAQTGTLSWALAGRYDLTTRQWAFEEAPLRWAGQTVEGLTVQGGLVYVLMHGPTGRTVWASPDGQEWQSVVLEGSSPLNLFRLASSPEAIIAVGKNMNGRDALWEILPGRQTATATVLPGDATLIEANRYLAVDAPHATPWIAVSRPSQGYTVQMASKTPEGWVLTATDLVGIPVAGAAATQLVAVLEDPEGTERSLHRLERGTWAACSSGSILSMPSAVFSDGNQTWLLSTQPEGFSLTSTTALCPP